MVTEARSNDGRMSAWVFREDVAHAIVECTKNATSAHSLLNANSKTGRRLLQREPVRQNVIRSAANAFLDFLFEVRDGGTIDGRFHSRIVKRAAEKYATDELGWSDLVEIVEDEVAGQPAGRPASADSSA